MSAIRQDAWSEKEDALVAEIVLKHIRTGSTQTKAFEEVGEFLRRTSAACAFRWNNVLRPQYEDAFDLAKKHRLMKSKELERKTKTVNNVASFEKNKEERKRGESTSSVTPTQSPELTHEMVLDYLQKHLSTNPSEELLSENKKLREELISLKEELHSMQEDYKAILDIASRAKQYVK